MQSLFLFLQVGCHFCHPTYGGEKFFMIPAAILAQYQLVTEQFLLHSWQLVADTERLSHSTGFTL